VEVLTGSEQRRMVYQQERSLCGTGDVNGSTITAAPTTNMPVVSDVPPPSAAKPASVVVSNPMTELQRSFEKLALTIERKLTTPSTDTSNSPNAQYSTRSFCCNWCDEPGHYMNRCDDFRRAREKGVIFFNEYGCICSNMMRKELLMAPGNGGLRRQVSEEGGQGQANATASVITFDDGEDVIAMDVEREMRVRMASVAEDWRGGYDAVDGWVEEKRKRDEYEPGRRSVRFQRDDEVPAPVSETREPSLPRPIATSAPLQDSLKVPTVTDRLRAARGRLYVGKKI